MAMKSALCLCVSQYSSTSRIRGEVGSAVAYVSGTPRSRAEPVPSIDVRATHLDAWIHLLEDVVDAVAE
jgi:hypothetical protein